uniref:Uncharacterized protein n=1 Tax=Lepeophtheirus salmonis TaxID=72036 RepID=A0A0K2VIM9_LEPSM
MKRHTHYYFSPPKDSSNC